MDIWHPLGTLNITLNVMVIWIVLAVNVAAEYFYPDTDFSPLTWYLVVFPKFKKLNLNIFPESRDCFGIEIECPTRVE